MNARSVFRRMVIVQRRRATVYKMKTKRHAGKCPCFVCGRHVPREDATAEHIIPRSKGGGDEITNIDISHKACNKKRGNAQ